MGMKRLQELLKSTASFTAILAFSLFIIVPKTNALATTDTISANLSNVQTVVHSMHSNMSSNAHTDHESLTNPSLNQLFNTPDHHPVNVCAALCAQNSETLKTPLYDRHNQRAEIDKDEEDDDEPDVFWCTSEVCTEPVTLHEDVLRKRPPKIPLYQENCVIRR